MGQGRQDATEVRQVRLLGRLVAGAEGVVVVVQEGGGVTKTITYTCDRCGNNFGRGDTRLEVQAEWLITDMNINDFSHRPHFDLCQPCGKDVMTYMRSKP
jgi:hypothetical protein